MSERSPESTGGWRQPQTPGQWHPPEEPESVGGWQEMPALPKELENQPQSTGEWHLPNPEQTPFTPESVLEVKEPGEESQEALTEAPAVTMSRSAATTAAAGLLPEDALFAIATNASDEAELQRKADAKKSSTPQAPEDVLFMLDKIDESDDDFDTFSMSELVALASLVDEEPKAGVTQGTSAPVIAPVVPPPDEEDSADVPATLSPAEKAIQQSGTLDPAEYARQQLAALEGTSSVGVATSELPPTSTDDPGAYARQQLAALEGTGANLPTSGMPAATTPTADPRQEELGRRFAEVEDEVHSLRQMLAAGQISQPQFEEQLRALMILDDDQVWWMIGAETDTWYKYVNNEWAIATPPKPARPVGITGGYSAIDDSLPRFVTDAQPTYYEEDIPLDENNMPLPRTGVATYDGDNTVVSSSYLDPQQRGAGPTLAGATVASPTVQATPAAYGGIESPYDQSAPPLVGDDGELEIDAPTYEEAAQNYRSNMLRNIVLGAAVLLGILFILGIGGIFLILAWYNGIVAKYETQIAALENYTPAFQTVTILDYRDRPLATLSQSGEERITVRLDDVSPFMIHAIVSLENERYYDDPGWDTLAIIRAFFQNLTAGEIESGASTITQQVARALVSQDATPSAERKLEEIVIAGELTRRYDKNFILQLYLNEFFFGNQSYGVEAASRFYFDVPASQLNLPQSAMLAGILQAPALYDPVSNPQVAFDRMDYVLERMAEVGCLQFTHGNYPQTGEFCVTQEDITRGETNFQKAQVEVRTYSPREFDTEYPHFVELVRQQLENAFTANVLYSQGFTVRTTLVPELQDYAQAQMDATMDRLAPNGVTTGSVMVTDPNTGAVFVYIGSADFYDEINSGQIDYARTYQQPGSAIKPMLYTTALSGIDRNGNGSSTDPGEYLTPASILWDVPTTYATTPPYNPVNFSGRFYGPVGLRTALQGSYNVSAVKTLEFTGTDAFRDTSAAMGIRWAENAIFGLPSANGATEVRLFDMMVAFGTIANGGDRVPLYVIESIRDRQGNEVPIQDTPLRAPRQEDVINPAVAYLMQNILSDDVVRGQSQAGFPANSALTLASLPKQNWVGAKTGTSDGGRDLWTMGFVSNAVVGVWLGRPDDGTTRDLTGFTAAAPLWNAVMTQVVNAARVRPTEFVRPAQIGTVSICPDTGAQAGGQGSCTSPFRNEIFGPNRLPPGANESFIQSATINTWTGLLVNEFCNFPEDTVTESFVNISDAAAIAWLRNTPDGRAAAARLRLPTALEPVPTAFCDINTQVPNANISYPVPNQVLIGPTQILGQVSAPANFDRYVLEFIPANGQNPQPIGNFSNVQQPNPSSVLGEWDTTRVPNGQYTLRLSVISREGGFVYRTVPVTVDNPLPTPTPTITPTLPPVIEFTPLPFENGPTPTVNQSGN